jgi:hypothetical protein
MGFNGWSATKLLTFVALCVAVAAAEPRPSGNLGITVMLANKAGVSHQILRQAEMEASRIFRAAGIDISWNDCSSTHQCHHAPSAHEFVVSIVAEGRTSSDLVYGVAFLDEAGMGKYADVFFRRIQSEGREDDENVSKLLGTVVAHELGHLLLGSHGHSQGGVMTPVWGQGTLHNLRMGSLLFTPPQALLMKAKIGSGQGIRPTTEFTLVRNLPLAP